MGRRRKTKSIKRPDDVAELVNLGVVTYLTQLLDTELLPPTLTSRKHVTSASDGRLVILDFGLMTEVTDDQRYGAYSQRPVVGRRLPAVDARRPRMTWSPRRRRSDGLAISVVA